MPTRDKRPYHEFILAAMRGELDEGEMLSFRGLGNFQRMMLASIGFIEIPEPHQAEVAEALVRFAATRPGASNASLHDPHFLFARFALFRGFEEVVRLAAVEAVEQSGEDGLCFDQLDKDRAFYEEQEPYHEFVIDELVRLRRGDDIAEDKLLTFAGTGYVAMMFLATVPFIEIPAEHQPAMAEAIVRLVADGDNQHDADIFGNCKVALADGFTKEQARAAFQVVQDEKVAAGEVEGKYTELRWKLGLS